MVNDFICQGCEAKLYKTMVKKDLSQGEMAEVNNLLQLFKDYKVRSYKSGARSEKQLVFVEHLESKLH